MSEQIKSGLRLVSNHSPDPYAADIAEQAYNRIDELEYVVKLLAARPGDDFLINDAQKAMGLSK